MRKRETERGGEGDTHREIRLLSPESLPAILKNVKRQIVKNAKRTIHP